MATDGTSARVGRRYIFDNALQRERERLALIEASFDPGTFRHLEVLSVREGWRCLEVAGGGGSVAEWLVRRVGSSGHVVATDLEPRFLAAIEAPNLEVRQHNILIDDLERDAFDLVHARLLLEHLPEPLRALRQMIAALKPDGWLLVEDFDYRYLAPDPAASTSDAEFYTGFVGALLQWFTTRGIDLDCGRRLFGWLRDLGLEQVNAEGRVLEIRGGFPYAISVKLAFEQMRAPFVASGLASDDEVDRFVALLDKPDFAWTSQIMFAAWGQRPSL
jgi:SAM-dependent methyltransferase